jgi:hypothetical protein
VQRARHLNAKPLGGWGSLVGTPLFVFTASQKHMPVVPVLVVLRSFKRPWCGMPASCTPVPAAGCTGA